MYLLDQFLLELNRFSRIDFIQNLFGFPTKSNWAEYPTEDFQFLNVFDSKLVWPPNYVYVSFG